jgi:uncharacterized protein (DUF952 family)
MNEKYIYHITKPDSWQAALAFGEYQGDTLHTEGFIHCSTAEQVVRTANRFYHNERGLILLQIEAARVKPEIRYEPGGKDGKDGVFPHIYGALNPDAVVATHVFEPKIDGYFELPPRLGNRG